MMTVSSTKKNIVANFLAKSWGFISTYLFIPLYLKFLGIEAYGLVGFFSSLMGVLVLADMGFTATLNRELARLSVRKGDKEEMMDLVRTYELIYLWISLFLVVIIWFLAPVISGHWLQSNNLEPNVITKAIRVMGIAIAFQLPSGLYFGGLMGLQLQVKANAIQTGWSIFRGAGTILILWLVSPTIIAFSMWQLLSNIIYCLVMRYTLWQSLSEDSSLYNPRFTRTILSNTKRYTIGMATIALLSTILIQADKIFVSKMLSLEFLGYYSIASALASLPLMLANPITSAIFPQFIKKFENKDIPSLVELYHKTCKLTSIVIIPATLTLAFFARDFVFAWTSNRTTATEVSLVTSFLLIGQLLQAITLVPFNYALSNGDTKLIIKVQIYSIILITPLLYLLLKNYGLVGGGISWLLMNVLSLPPYMYLFHKKFLPGELKTWFLRDIGQPFLISTPIIGIGYLLFATPSSVILTFGLIGLVWLVAAIATILSFAESRDFIIQYIDKVKSLKQ
jgi:O-antigen/teichoic acid export membrane protein